MRIGVPRIAPGAVLLAVAVDSVALDHALVAHTLSLQAAVLRFLVIVVAMNVGWSVVRAIVDGYAEHNDELARRSAHEIVDADGGHPTLMLPDAPTRQLP
jgi:hypothetical protein